MRGDSTLFFIIGLLIVILVLAILIIRLELRLKKLLRGKNGSDLEQAIIAIDKSLDDLSKNAKETNITLERFDKRLRRSLQGIHTVRFNPYNEGQGGGQSFATAMLDENGDGVVLSTILAHNNLRVFAKPVKGHVSELKLSDEEGQAIEGAKVS